MIKRGVRGKLTKYSRIARMLSAFLCIAIVVGAADTVTVYATESTKQQLEEAKEKKEQSQSELDNTKDDIE